MAELSMPEYARQIGIRSAGGYEYPEVEVLKLTGEAARMAIRLEGAVILDAWVDDPRGNPIKILTSEVTDEHRSRLRAGKPRIGTHAMSPVGPYAGLGGQHGPIRYTQHTVQRINESTAELTGVTPDNYLQYTERFEVSTSGQPNIMTMLKVTNNTGKRQHTSLGEHFYFHLPGGDAEGLEVNSQVDTAPINDPELREKIMAGDAQYWPDHMGTIGIQFPGGYKLLMTSVAKIETDTGKSEPIDQDQYGMLFWHRPGDPEKGISNESICIEPTIGYSGIIDGKVRNRDIELEAGSTLFMRTYIGLA